jgi:hypothetical protein
MCLCIYVCSSKREIMMNMCVDVVHFDLGYTLVVLEAFRLLLISSVRLNHDF